MFNGSRRRAPTRPIYIESSDEENGHSISSNQPQTVLAGGAPTASPSPPTSSSSTPKIPSLKRKSSEPTRVLSINDALMRQVFELPVEKVHSSSRHSVSPILACRPQLLVWYDKVKSLRGMPWRKDYDPDLGPDAQSQRAYEVLTSEIMLQQTQMSVPKPQPHCCIDVVACPIEQQSFLTTTNGWRPSQLFTPLQLRISRQ